MEFSNNEAAQTALFDEYALLFSVEGDIADTQALLDAFIAEAHEKLSSMHDGISRNDFNKILQTALTLQSLSDSVKSKILSLAAGHAAKMASIRNMDEVISAVQSVKISLKSFELHLNRSGWM